MLDTLLSVIEVVRANISGGDAVPQFAVITLPPRNVSYLAKVLISLLVCTVETRNIEKE